MLRRDLLRLLAASAALPFVPRSAEAALEFGRSAHRAVRAGAMRALDPAQAELVSALADLILPRTDTPGALDVNVPGFIDHLLADWYTQEEREQFLAGLAAIEGRPGGFTALPPERQVAVLTGLDTATGEPGSAPWAFARIKALTVYGYFTSERVMKEVTRVQIIPGRFEGCVRV
jgi:hypothetical protein